MFLSRQRLPAYHSGGAKPRERQATMEHSPILQAFLATLFTWGVTALGAAWVFTAREVSRRMLDTMLGFTAGVMIAASFWSLLAPAIEMAERSGSPGWVPAVTGFLLGGAFLRGADMVLPHLHLWARRSKAEGIRTNCTLVFTANQGLLAAKAGAYLLSPFVGRVDDIGGECCGVGSDPGGGGDLGQSHVRAHPDVAECGEHLREVRAVVPRQRSRVHPSRVCRRGCFVRRARRVPGGGTPARVAGLSGAEA